MACTYQYDPTPGRHTRGGLTPQQGNQPPEAKYNYEGTGPAYVEGVSAQETLSAGGYCQFTEFALSPGSKFGLINAATGFNYDDDEQRRLGLRAFIMRHAFNIREGLRRKDWTISDRIIGIPPLEDGPLAGVTVDGKKIADDFFKEIGFDQDAVPLKKTLEEIGGLENVIKDLYPEG
jgi:aldehyde:ferredoxin oxidoreductase